MNTIKTAAVIFLATAAAVASAEELVSVPAAAPSGVTREQVKQELQQAIANSEIRHGDLVDFLSLVEPSVERHPGAALADGRNQQSERTADVKTNESSLADGRRAQAPAGKVTSSGR